MHVGRPHAAVSPSLDGDVLVVLAGSKRPMSGREVARLVRTGSQAGVNRALRRLAQHGLVEAQEAGAAILYSLNREHLAAPIVESLASLRAELLRRLKTSLGDWPIAPVHASLFGSTARADGDTSSDIDILLVRPKGTRDDDARWRQQVEAWARDIQRWTGNRVGLAEVSEQELGRLRKHRPAVVADLLADGITLFGPSVSSLLGRSSR